MLEYAVGLSGAQLACTEYLLKRTILENAVRLSDAQQACTEWRRKQTMLGNAVGLWEARLVCTVQYTEAVWWRVAEMAALNISVKSQRQRQWQDMNSDATRDATEH
jgi:hypothetical protein